MIVSISPSLVLWSERLGYPVTDALMEKTLRQYLRIIEQTREYKRKKRSTPEGREHLKRLNRESRARVAREQKQK